MTQDPQTIKRIATYDRMAPGASKKPLESRVLEMDRFIACQPRFTLFHHFADRCSGVETLRGRPGAGQLLVEAARGNFDVLLVRSPERLSRDFVDQITFTKTLSALGVECRYLAERIAYKDHCGASSHCRWEAVPLDFLNTYLEYLPILAGREKL